MRQLLKRTFQGREKSKLLTNWHKGSEEIILWANLTKSILFHIFNTN
jgi:hypothetical protein